MLGIGFNPRTHTGCDIIKLRLGSEQVVSIHAPTRGATSLLFSLDVETEFQSTHPHGVRLIVQIANPVLVTVSIHAPTRGATWAGLQWSSSGAFQSTHPHGVRPQGQTSYSRPPTRFNPRTHTGCDPTMMRYIKKKGVSIHAPTRGATIRTFDRLDS